MEIRDFARYYHELKMALAEMQDDTNYKVKQGIARAAASPEDILELEMELIEKLGDGFEIYKPIKAFNKIVLGFEFGWSYSEQTHKDRVVAGKANIASVYSIYDPDEEYNKPSRLFEEYRLLDNPGSQAKVYLKFTTGIDEPQLIYFDAETQEYTPLQLTFEAYLHCLKICRAMYPWQHFFLENKSLCDKKRMIQFLDDMELLFPREDATVFNP